MTYLPMAHGFLYLAAIVRLVERIAVFDNDGTLWVEQPMYVQLLFMLDRVKVLAHAQVELKMATHAGMTTEAFERTVVEWIATAEHSMLEFLAYTSA